MIDIGGVPLPWQITAATAAIFYAATYLSFVHLLRYPRNWAPVSPAGSLATGGLAVLTVALVALSRDGLDIPALAAAVTFIGVLLFIISAPAMAFRPASRLSEFLARHGEHAGTWLIGPAIVIGLAVPNESLCAVLVTAMAIELTWFLRQRWAGRGLRKYTLSGRDLSVLKSQAKGNIRAFRRRHGIKELVLSPSGVSWGGCTKETPPCPFNLYVNRLGLNTAPCCREHMQDLSHHIAACLRDMGVVHWLEGGSLLGAVRERGRLLEWEDDVDISVLLDDEMTWQRLAAGLIERCEEGGYFVDLFERNGFISISFDAPKRWPMRWERNRLRGEIRADIAIYRKALSFGEAVLERRSHKGAMRATENGGFGVPAGLVLPTSTVPFLGSDIASPNQPDTYLRALYGDFETVEYTYVDAAPAKSRAPIDAVEKSLAG